MRRQEDAVRDCPKQPGLAREGLPDSKDHEPDVSESRETPAVEYPLEGLGERIRTKRLEAGLTQRDLAGRLNLSASMISQIESGRSKPSVGTLYAIVNEFGLSLDALIKGEESLGISASEITKGGEKSPLVRSEDRQAIELESGVLWEKLAGSTEDAVDFLYAIYDVSGASTSDHSLMRHQGRECGYVMSGTLGIQVGFDHYELNPGDSIAFDSTVPHRLYNNGERPVEAIWLVVGRSAPTLDSRM